MEIYSVFRLTQKSAIFAASKTARDIARSHGGDVVLSQSSEGGLRAVIEVPI